jgi:hypothetical protein
MCRLHVVVELKEVSPEQCYRLPKASADLQCLYILCIHVAPSQSLSPNMDKASSTDTLFVFERRGSPCRTQSVVSFKYVFSSCSSNENVDACLTSARTACGLRSSVMTLRCYRLVRLVEELG